MPQNKRASRGSSRKIRYAVIGQGYISQIAVLPAFANAKRNSELTALISDDPAKLKKLGRQYGVESLYGYDRYAECLQEVDAVYIALPNNMHAEYTIAAAKAGKHILCEKPLASNSDDCQRMIDAARENNVKLMTAYRLHFERSNMEVVELIKQKKIGEPRYFNSIFSQQIQKGNSRLDAGLGGGPVWDMGIYCLNAARYLFRDEPIEVFASAASSSDPRFKEVDEMVSVILRFPGDRLATFTCSFGAAAIGRYDIVGTKGSITLDQGYEMVKDIKRVLTVNDRPREKMYPARDQFAPELLYFSDCILNNKTPEPGGLEGMIDVQIIEAIHDSARSSQPVSLDIQGKQTRPTLDQETRRSKVTQRELYHAEKPSKE